ncbi:HigA family addiction module antitoxin [Sinomonas atrocyanea]|uniref:HigA family addiction module antitoxin n=1 Tax=Sinomonas atrocyanea TaxID=37927 RepID=UPI001471EDB3|nr:HigA family addiction module antitoxin [Sinomonas atrocyanea]
MEHTFTEDEAQEDLGELIRRVHEDGSVVCIVSGRGTAVLMSSSELEALGGGVSMIEEIARRLRTKKRTAEQGVHGAEGDSGGAKTRLTARVLRDGAHWYVSVPQIPGLVTQARMLGEVAEMVADQAASRTGRPESDFEIAIDLLDLAAAIAPDREEADWAKPRTPIHPGRVLSQDFLDALGLSQEQLARATGLPEAWIAEFVSGSAPLTADAALRLSRAFELSDRYWMDLQADYELVLARRASPMALSHVLSLVPRHG